MIRRNKQDNLSKNLIVVKAYLFLKLFTRNLKEIQKFAKVFESKFLCGNYSRNRKDSIVIFSAVKEGQIRA